MGSKRKEKGKEIKKEKKQKIQYLPTIPTADFSFFDGMFDDFITNMMVLLAWRHSWNVRAFAFTCKRMSRYLYHDHIVIRIMQMGCGKEEEGDSLVKDLFFHGSKAGYMQKNYGGYIDKVFNKISDREYEPDYESDEYERILKEANLHDTYYKLFSAQFCGRLISFCKAPLFQVYSRLLSYSLDNFPILKVHKSLHLFTPRNLHSVEKTLFSEISTPEEDRHEPIENPIHSFSQFITNMDKKFKLNSWREFINWDNFVVLGGSVLKCILVDSFESSSQQDVDFFWIGDDFYDYEEQVDFFAKTLSKMVGSNNVHKEIFRYIRTIEVNFNTEKDPHIVLFQFIWYSKCLQTAKALNIFDLDCCQVGYNGKIVICSAAFPQSIATRTIINYKLINSFADLSNFLPRTLKYQKRGFTLLVPKNFKTKLLYREYDPKKVRPAVDPKRKYGFLLNNDSLCVRQRFINLIAPAPLQMPLNSISLSSLSSSLSDIPIIRDNCYEYGSDTELDNYVQRYMDPEGENAEPWGSDSDSEREKWCR